MRKIFWKIISVFSPARPVRPLILMYHSIGRNPANFTVRPEEFEKQMGFLRKSGRLCLTISEFVWRLKSGDLPETAVAVTFDDGYLDNYTEALPILKKYSIPGTIFVATGYIGRDYQTSEGVVLPMMSEAELRNMSREDLIEIAPHGHEHLVLRDLSPLSVAEDVAKSKQIIEGLSVGGDLDGTKRVSVLAYPYGKYSAETVQAISNLGFEAGVTVEEGMVDQLVDFFHLPRMAVSAGTSFSEFRCKVGNPEIYLKIKHAYRRTN